MAAATTGARDTSPSTTEPLSPACREELPPPPQQQQQVVLFASPGAGHLIPLVELARRLIVDHGLAITVVTLTGMSNPATDAAVLSSLPASAATAVLTAVSLDDLPPDTDFGVLMFELVRRSLPHLRALMEGLSGGPVTALVCDFFGTAALPVAAELGVEGYVFFPNSFAMISIMRHIVELHADAAPGEYRDLPIPVPLPGGPALRHDDLPYGFRDRTDPVYAYLVEEARRYGRADGFLVNSFEELEIAMAETFKRDAEDGAFPPVYPVGPIVRSSSGEVADESACLEWLDRQPENSVVYVSFGTGGALSVEQTAELAAGLEASGHRFLWVVRMPSVDGNACTLGTVPGDMDDPLAWLPEGFLERTRDQGLAVAAWVPQVRVLSHRATAAFVSHCGWNSTLESVAAGVPMVAWPLYAEQKTNAAILTEVTGVALRRAAAHGDGNGDGLVSREKIAAAVRELVEGEKGSAVRGRARELREAAARAWSPEGSSRRALGEVVGRWKAALISGNGTIA
jgi:hydroquinone glucosyltransferase